MTHRSDVASGSLTTQAAKSAGSQTGVAAYTRTAQWLHWIIATLIFIMLPLGFYMAGLPLSPQKLKLYSWHKWAGVTIFLLVTVRLVWRLTHRPPALPAQMSALVQRGAHAGHVLLYVLMLAIPLSGWLMSSAKGIQTVWFGIVPLPDLVSKSKPLGDLLLATHVNLNLLLIAVIAGHVIMALKHHFIDRDGTMHRMLSQPKSED